VHLEYPRVVVSRDPVAGVLPLVLYSMMLNLTKEDDTWCTIQDSKLYDTGLKYSDFVRYGGLKMSPLMFVGFRRYFWNCYMPLAFKHSSSSLPLYSPAECCNARRLEEKWLTTPFVQCSVSIRRKAASKICVSNFIVGNQRGRQDVPSRVRDA
jgi:hypothetical protein